MKLRYAFAAVLGITVPLSIIAGIQWYGAVAAANIVSSLSPLSQYSRWDGAGTAALIVIVFLAINIGVLTLLGWGSGALMAPLVIPAKAGKPTPDETPEAAAPAAEPIDLRAVRPGDTIDSLAMRIMEAERAEGASSISLSRARRQASEALAQSNE